MMDVAMVGPAKYERIADDAYFTREEWVTRALMQNYGLRGPVWECAAGGGHMAEVLRDPAFGYEVIATDIKDHGYPLNGLSDFLRDKREWHGSIVTNPPYDLAQEFVEHSRYVTHWRRGSVAMLLRNEWDCAKSRAKLFADDPTFAMKIVLRRRPRWVEGPGASPRHNFAWYVWDWRHEGKPEIRWAA